MLLKKGNFYVLTIDSGTELLAHDGNEFILTDEVDEMIFYNNIDIEVNCEVRLCTELEKEFWVYSMDIIDKEVPNENFCGVSMCDFEDWEIEMGYKD